MDKCKHVQSYVLTIEAIKAAEELRQMEANLKFMARPYKVQQRIRRVNKAKAEAQRLMMNSNNGKMHYKLENDNSKIPEIRLIEESQKTLNASREGTISSKGSEQYAIYTSEGFGKRSFSNFVVSPNSFPSSVKTEKEIKKLKKQKKKEDKMKRKRAKKEFKSEQKKLITEAKMRKILQKRLKLKMRRAHKERKRAEKMFRLQRKLEKFGKCISDFVKKVFNIASIALGILFLTLGLFTAGISPVPFLLLGTAFVLIGIGGMCVKVFHYVETYREGEKYKKTYLETLPTPQTKIDVPVFI